MSDRSHLIPDTTIDINGHAKTVYRAPNATVDSGTRLPSLVTPRVATITPDSTIAFAMEAKPFNAVWADTNRIQYADDYISEYKDWDGWNFVNDNGTLNALTSEGGIIYFLEPSSGELVLTSTPGDFYFAGIATPPIVEPTEAGYSITYLAGDENDDDNRAVRFEIDHKGDYLGTPGTVTLYKNNTDAENALEAIRGH